MASQSPQYRLDVIQISHNKDIKLFNKDLVDVALKTNLYIGKTKRHNLIFTVAVHGIKSCLLLVTFLSSHLIIGTSDIQLDKLFYLAQPIENFAN